MMMWPKIEKIETLIYVLNCSITIANPLFKDGAGDPKAMKVAEDLEILKNSWNQMSICQVYNSFATVTVFKEFWTKVYIRNIPNEYKPQDPIRLEQCPTPDLNLDPLIWHPTKEQHLVVQDDLRQFHKKSWMHALMFWVPKMKYLYMTWQKY